MNDSQGADPGLLSLSAEQHEASETPFSRDVLRAVGELVLTTTYDGVWLIDAEARTTFVNDRTARLLGYTVEEMLGLSIFHFMDDEGRGLTAHNLSRRRDGIAEQHEFKCLRKDGSPIWLLVTANPVYDRSGSYAGSLAMIADLSLMKAREDALRADRADLERRLAQLSRTQASLEAIAYRDSLTGLRNRRYVDERLFEETARARRHERRVCVLFFDVDGFKRVNDRWGHAVGDEVLRGIGRALRAAAEDAPCLLRASDVAARYGGDEFIVLAPETDLEGGHKLGERILERVRGTPISFGPNQRVVPSLSVGVAACPFHANAPDELIAAADRAMFRAKLAGGGRVCLADPPTVVPAAPGSGPTSGGDA